MRGKLLLLLALSGLAIAGLSPASLSPASAQGYPNRAFPFCLRGAPTGGTLDCAYTSYQQCQATASGVGAYCYENPMWTRAEVYPYPVRKRRHYAY